ncbi:hypothetical protein L5M11_02935 [Shewanella sp. SM87]|uniref:hypothetical protein n=1 Tax=Shewanella sp. SM87 TaxID=2912808 RepID=UPI0021D863F0|nr:hypothetical protein [Shewanella sp. SM87]MCU8006484.1 hypothetical protein [Shewanella sp. SM87]
MKKFLVAVLGVAILSGCAAPRYTAKPIETNTKNVEIVIIKDKETRDGFQETMETWLKQIITPTQCSLMVLNMI